MVLKIINRNKSNIENKDSLNDSSAYQDNIVIECKNLNLWYEETQALIDINMKFKRNEVTAIIGPSGCGKSTLLRCFNRMNDVIEGCKIEGEVLFQGKNLYAKDADVRLFILYLCKETSPLIREQKNL